MENWYEIFQMKDSLIFVVTDIIKKIYSGIMVFNKTTFVIIIESKSVSCLTTMMEPICAYNQWLFAIYYFCENAPS